MWAQIIKVRVNEGREAEVVGILDQLNAIEQPDSGLLRTSLFRDQADPSSFQIMVVFENEEKAREREADPRRAEGLKAIQAQMAGLYAGPPEFLNLDVMREIVR